MDAQREGGLARGWQADPDRAWESPPPAWQRYTADLHEELLKRWVGDLPEGALVLKTDLFEEALGQDHPVRRISELGWQPMGMDIGHRIAAAAARRGALCGGLGPIVTDIRCPALADGSIPAILCNSTLDHFPEARDIQTALREIVRVLEPGGKLILTLDNPRNPIVALRNALPRRITSRLGITDFYVGATLGLAEARRRLRDLGLVIQEDGTLMHGFRYLALRRMRRQERRGPDSGAVRESLLRKERRAHWPTAQLTGHFVYLVANKPTTHD